MDDHIRQDSWVALKLPSGVHKVIQLRPNSTISLGKYGTFETNSLLDRPYYHTYEIVEAQPDCEKHLRIVPSSELVEHDAVPEADLSGDQPIREGEAESRGQFEVVDQAGRVLMRTNQNILDQAGAQKLTMAEIEELKKAESASGRDIIARIMESHSELDKKTAFSLAKYTTRKANKYLRRFIPFPLDVSALARWWLYEKEAPRILDMREEMLALALSWSNVHFTQDMRDAVPDMSQGRWLVVDETGGLIVAALAERLGVLLPYSESGVPPETFANPSNGQDQSKSDGATQAEPQARLGSATIVAQETHMAASQNTIHLIHANAQPNLALLNFFSYDYANTLPTHPLHYHLKTINWLQIVQPEQDPLYAEPESFTAEELAEMKSSKRGTYYRKRRRWQRTRQVVDEVRAGEFDGLLVCSSMTPVSPIRHLVPLLKGGAPVAVYSPTVEPLAELVDLYSTARRSAFASLPDDEQKKALAEGEDGDFPANPSLLLSPAIFTARCRPWQVLPGRTHPVMTGLGGTQGYLFTATRVIPIAGEKVEARGSFKRRKTTKEQSETRTDEMTETS